MGFTPFTIYFSRRPYYATKAGFDKSVSKKKMKTSVRVEGEMTVGRRTAFPATCDVLASGRDREESRPELKAKGLGRKFSQSESPLRIFQHLNEARKRRSHTHARATGAGAECLACWIWVFCIPGRGRVSVSTSRVRVPFCCSFWWLELSLLGRVSLK